METCADCKAPIVWGRLFNGGRMRLDAPHDPKGNIVLHSDGVCAQVPRGLPLRVSTGTIHTSHDVTCPTALERRAADQHAWRRRWP